MTTPKKTTAAPAATGDKRDASWLAGLFADGTILDAKGAAKYLKRSKYAVEAAVLRGALPAVSVGGKKLFTAIDLDTYMARTKNANKGRTSTHDGSVKLFVGGGAEVITD